MLHGKSENIIASGSGSVNLLAGALRLENTVLETFAGR